MKSALAVVAVATLLACSQAPAPAPAAPPPAPAPVAAPAPPAEPAAPPLSEAAAAPLPRIDNSHDRVGPGKCKVCHKLQHDSWVETPHAARHLDCEGCHGGGSDFMKVMRNRTAAIAAGLILPKKEFCQQCHKKDWQEGMFLRVHAHKAK
jgi:hypothetical protein